MIFCDWKSRWIIVFGKEKKLDFTYIDDCVDGLVRIIKRFDKVAGLTFNLSAGKGETLLHLAKTIVAEVGSKSQIDIGVKRVGEISSFIGDLTLARTELGYAPKVSLQEGLKHNIKWYVEAMKIRRNYETQRRNLARRGWA